MNEIIGPETVNIIGAFHEDSMLSFFSAFCKWELFRHPVDFKQTEHSKKKYGIDAIYSCFDPFLNKKLGILIECKFRGNQEKHLTARILQEEIGKLKEKVQVAGISSTLKRPLLFEKKIDEIYHGILFLRLGNYSLESFKETLSKVKIEKSVRRGKFPTIYILDNYKISTFIDFYNKIGKKTIMYYYPSYMKNQRASYEETLSFTYLCSDIILGKYGGDGSYRKFVLSFEEPSERSIKYLDFIINYFQHLSKGEDLDLFFSEGDSQMKHFYKHMVPEYINEDFNVRIIEKNLQSKEDLKEVFK